ncbi:MAG: ATP-grasp domain-containing protein, partial [Magnetococcales bacterium]|nr:ATP-grasp domain-containing protein [Magnetococcales bacterium]
MVDQSQQPDESLALDAQEKSGTPGVESEPDQSVVTSVGIDALIKKIKTGSKLADYTEFKARLSKKVKLSSAILAETARELGMEVEFVTRDILSVTDSIRTVLFFETSSVTMAVRRLTADKALTKDILAKKGLRVPVGKTFESLGGGVTYFNTMNKPMVVKPLDLSWGQGVTVNITRQDEFENAARRALKDRTRYLVEEHCEGTDVRLLVVGKQAVGAFVREPANVIGDGKSTIRQLVLRKNTARRKLMYAPPIKSDERMTQLLRKVGYDVTSVPKRGEMVFLNNIANVSAGGDSIAIFDHVHESYHALAVRAVEAFPGLEYAGVDFLIQDFTRPATADNYVILEINANAAMTGAMFPVFGKSVPVATHFLQHYFPKAPEPVWQEPEPVPVEVEEVIVESVEESTDFAREANAAILYGIVEASRNDFSNSRYLSKVKSSSKSLLAAVATRRGYRVQPLNGTLYSLIGEKCSEIFLETSPASSIVGWSMANKLHLIKLALAGFGLPVPKGEVFLNEKKALKYYVTCKDVQVVRAAGADGRQVTVAPNDATAFLDGVRKVRQQRKHFIVEDRIEGDRVRFVLVSGRIESAVCCLPAYVIGDGVHSVAELIALKNETRKKNPLMKSFPIRSAYLDRLGGEGGNLSDIPEVDHRVTLSSTSTVEAGGEIVSVLESLHPSVLRMAEQVGQAIPWEPLLRVDILVKNFCMDAFAKQNACVVDVRANPSIATPYFAAYGPPATNLPNAILDLLESGQYETKRRTWGEPGILPAEVYTPMCGGKSFVRDGGVMDRTTMVRLLRQAAFARNLMVQSLDDDWTILSDGTRRTGFNMGMPSCTRLVARRASNDKEWTKRRLRNGNIRTPRGMRYTTDAKEAAWSFIREQQYAVVVKPVVGSGGKGVTTNITTREHFDEAWAIATASRSKYILVEEYFVGKEYRVFVIGNTIRAATQRIAAHVVGDGEHTIEQLIKLKNEFRRANPYSGVQLMEITPNV